MKGVIMGKPVCSSCGSKQVLFRKSTKTQYCRVCGHEWDWQGTVWTKKGAKPCKTAKNS